MRCSNTVLPKYYFISAFFLDTSYVIYKILLSTSAVEEYLSYILVNFLKKTCQTVLLYLIFMSFHATKKSRKTILKEWLKSTLSNAQRNANK